MRGGFSEMSRKLIHVAMGFFALLLAYLTWWQALLLALIAFLHNLLVLPLYARERIFRGEAGERGHDVGIVLYPASIVVLIVAFHSRLEIVAAAWGLLAFGDGFATIVGKTVGGPRLPWKREKSWSGYLAFLFFGFMAARFLYVWTILGQMRGESTSPYFLFGSFFDTAQGRPVTLAVVSACNGWSLPFVAIVGATSLLAATLETLPLGLDDNLSVPLASGGFLFSLTLIDPAIWALNRERVLSNLPWAIGVNGVLAAVAYAAGSVSVSGVIGGVLMGGLLYTFGGWRAFTMLAVFFVLGTVATRMGYARKAALGIAQERGGRRGAKNAIANCGIGALLAFVAATSPYGSLATLGLVAAFATAACDTVSSEIGQAYGRRTFLITTFRPAPPGTDGAISLEGTLAGIAGGAAVALSALALGLVSAWGAGLVVLAGLFGSTLESYVGAAWEGSRSIDNEAVNLANTLAGALFAIGIAASVSRLPFSPGG